MKSRLAEELKLRYEPVAIVLTDDRPAEALQFAEGKWGCVIAMFAAAAKGKTAIFDKDTVACGGGSIGLGFCDNYNAVPGGIEYFLSTGRGEGYPEGEAYKKTPQLARAFAEQLPKTLIPTKYVMFKPLSAVDPERERPEVVAFLANPDQISALTVLANYDRPTNDNVIVSFSAGCHQLFLLPYDESKKETPRAVLGCTDISARPYVDQDTLSFAVPFAMYEQMEANIPGSFLEKHDWKKVRDRIS